MNTPPLPLVAAYAAARTTALGYLVLYRVGKFYEVLQWDWALPHFAWIMTEVGRWLAELVRLPIALVVTDFFPLPDCCVERITSEAPDLLNIAAHGTRPGNRCPDCGQASRAVHSLNRRKPADLSLAWTQGWRQPAGAPVLLAQRWLQPAQLRRGVARAGGAPCPAHL